MNAACGPNDSVIGASGSEMPSTEVLAIMFTPSGAFICVGDERIDALGDHPRTVRQDPLEEAWSCRLTHAGRGRRPEAGGEGERRGDEARQRRAGRPRSTRRWCGARVAGPAPRGAGRRGRWPAGRRRPRDGHPRPASGPNPDRTRSPKNYRIPDRPRGRFNFLTVGNGESFADSAARGDRRWPTSPGTSTSSPKCSRASRPRSTTAGGSSSSPSVPRGRPDRDRQRAGRLRGRMGGALRAVHRDRGRPRAAGRAQGAPGRPAQHRGSADGAAAPRTGVLHGRRLVQRARAHRGRPAARCPAWPSSSVPAAPSVIVPAFRSR